MKKIVLLSSLLLAACGGGGSEPEQADTKPAEPGNHAPTASALGLSYDWQSQQAAGNWRALANDKDGDSLSAQVQAQGQLGTFTVDGDQLRYQADAGALGDDSTSLLVSDGRGGEAVMRVTVSQVDGRDGVTRALSEGNADFVADGRELLVRIQARIDAIQADQAGLVQSLFADGAIDYAPGNRTQLFKVTEPDRTFGLIQANQGRLLAVAGQQGQGRYAGFGTDLFYAFDRGELLAVEGAAKRLVGWLLDTDSPETARTVAVAFMGGQESGTQDWLKAAYPNWTLVSCNDAAALAQCLADAELVVSGWRGNDADAESIAAVYRDLLAQGVPLFYQHNWYEATNKVADAIAAVIGAELPYGGNYWANAGASWASANAMLAERPWLGSEARLSQHFIDGDFAFDWSGCTSHVGKISCDQVAGFRDAFLDGAERLKTSLNSLDAKGVVLFEEQGRELLKLFVLLGDKYRAGIAYPMDKASTDTTTFLKAYLADHLAYYHREHNPAQGDLGNFSDALPAGLPLVEQSLSFELGKDGGYRGTGLYLLPGQPIHLTRTDGQALPLKVFINTQRTGSTREFNDNGYQRPKFLKSPQFELVGGAEQILTSPYGGPLMVQLPAGSGQVSLRVSQVTPYPYLTDFAQASSYLAEMDGSPIGWAGLRTDFVEINSRKHMMQSFIQGDRYQGDVQQALDDVWTYMIKGTYDLAGFQGEGLALPAKVLERCQSLGWDCQNADIHGKPRVQHINVDEAAHCGGGCAGNPYDQAWVLSPFGWGESHEIGHNLQRSRLKIYGGRSTEVSNNIFPLYKGWQRYQDTGELIGSCDRQSPATTYGWLQQAHNQADPSQAMYDKLWSQSGTYDNAGTRLDFYWQLAMLADELAGLDNGWQIYSLLYLHERQFSRARNDAASWAAQKDALGMGSFAEAPNPDGNDFMLMSLSYLLGRDMRGYFDAWGITYSPQASGQVAAYGLPAAELVYYQADSHCQTLKAPKLPIDGTTSWPAS
ncbi:ImpA family metalloprotease [Gallaecimonas sp. GXIMD4217]|uniref:ImpA family metalloprotease n=1 Tax=Gallaecimonas sp. GXIMD4217 TaxID=3131927 RepID=UPI00311AE21D